MMRWVQRTVFVFMAAVLIIYVADWSVFKIYGSATSKVTVSHFVSAALKNNKQELDYLGSEDVPCSDTLFPQGGYTPCWYLRRHSNQVSSD